MPNYTLDELKAFPTAEGSGALTTGGRGKKVYKVTTLVAQTSSTYVAPSGGKDGYYYGGLLDALDNDDVGYVVFDVSGAITLPNEVSSATQCVDYEGWLSRSGSAQIYGYNGQEGVKEKSILGHVAPTGGIVITNGHFAFDKKNSDGNDNLIFRHIRSRPRMDRWGQNLGYNCDDAYTWGLKFSKGAENIIVDHCTFSFAHDKGIGFSSQGHPTNIVNNITVQNCIIADNGTNLIAGVNPNQADDPEDRHDNISVIKNLFANSHRTPNAGYNGNIEVTNNIMFDIDWRLSNVYYQININYDRNLILAPNIGAGSDLTNMWQQGLGLPETPLIYAEENIYEGSGIGLRELTGSPAEDNSVIWRKWTANPESYAPIESQYFTNTRHTQFNGYTPKTTTETYQELITDGNVGAFRFLDNNGNRVDYRDSWDSDLLTRVDARDKSYGTRVDANWEILPSIPTNTRLGNYDSIIPGIDDTFSTEHGITSANEIKTNWDFSTYTVTNTAGYEAIEIYSAWIANDFQQLEEDIPVLTLNTIKAFPTAQGFGKNATGGRGGTVYEVTTLNDSGPGSLRAAVAASGTRTVVFKVAGNIVLTNQLLVVTNPNITIAGETAPGDGITITDDEFSVEVSNVIIRNIRFRRGHSNVTWSTDAFGIRNWTSSLIENVIIDHCTMSWGIDETIDTGNAGNTTGGLKNMTISNSIIGPSQPYGWLLWYGVERMSSYRNYFVGNSGRNPLVGSPDGIEELTTYLRAENINTIVYGAGGSGGISYGLRTSWIGNVWKDYNGQVIPDYQTRIYILSQAGEDGNMRPNTEYYSNDNSLLNPATSINPSYPFRTLEDPNVEAYRVGTPTETSSSTTIAASALVEDLLPTVGPLVRDSYDTSLIASYYASTAPRQDETLPTLASGTAYPDTNNNGIDDNFEVTHGITSANQVITNWNFGTYTVVNTAAYRAIEIYLAWLAGDFDYLLSTGNVAGDTSYTVSAPINPDPDLTPPIVTQIIVSNILDDSFKVQWNLDEDSKGSIEYGTSTGVYTRVTPLRNQFSTSFIEEIGATIPLQPNTTYYWRIKTEDSLSNIGYSAEQNTITLEQVLRNNKPVGFGAGPIIKAYVGSVTVIK